MLVNIPSRMFLSPNDNINNNNNNDEEKRNSIDMSNHFTLNEPNGNYLSPTYSCDHLSVPSFFYSYSQSTPNVAYYANNNEVCVEEIK